MQPKATSAGPPTGIVHCFHLWALILKTIAQAQLAAQNTQSWLQGSRDARGGPYFRGAGRGQKSAGRGGAKVKIRGAGRGEKARKLTNPKILHRYLW